MIEMDPYLLYGIIGALVILVLYLLISPYKKNVNRNLDTKVLDQNRKAREDVDKIQAMLDEKQARKTELDLSISVLEGDFERKQNLLNEKLQEKEKTMTAELVEIAKKEAIAKIELVEIELHKTMTDFAELKKTKIEEFDYFKEVTQESIRNFKSLEAAAIAARMREYEELNKETFYCIQLEEIDLVEIKEILGVVELFRNTVPIRKAIFDIYYRKPLKDLTQRLTLGHKISGVYKITHIESGKCYIGQSVDISNRWLQHCKRGFGVDAVTNNKLYPEMYKHGIHSFKYEIVEEVEKAKLSEREKYWSDYFGAQVFGYTMKA